MARNIFSPTDNRRTTTFKARCKSRSRSRRAVPEEMSLKMRLSYCALCRHPGEETDFASWRAPCPLCWTEQTGLLEKQARRLSGAGVHWPCGVEAGFLREWEAGRHQFLHPAPLWDVPATGLSEDVGAQPTSLKEVDSDNRGPQKPASDIFTQIIP